MAQSSHTAFDPSTDRCARRDMATFVLVEAVCLSYSDTGKAAAFLASKHVPFEVAHRVLLHPNRRRGMK